MEVAEALTFYAIIFIIYFEFAWNVFLSLRQYKVYMKVTQIPTELIGILPQKTFDKARNYAIHKCQYIIMHHTFISLLSMVYLFLECMPMFWKLSYNILQWMGYEPGEMSQSALFMVIVNTAFFIIDFPFSVYYHFNLEEKHGFNNLTLMFHIYDKLKRHLLEQIIVIPFTSAIIYVIQKGGDYFVIYVWFVVMLATFFILLIQPDFIAPLFDKFTPLPEGELKTEIEKLAASLGFPLYKIFVIEGSKRSKHSNAYIFGLFNKKRIVLFDTLIKDYVPKRGKFQKKKRIEEEAEEQKEKENVKDNENETKNEKEKEAEGKNGNEKEKEMEKENGKKNKEKKGCEMNEILAILAHELGHWKSNHIFKKLVFLQVNVLILCVIFAKIFRYQTLYRAFGFHDSEPLIVGLTLVLQFACLPYYEMLKFCMSFMSRRFEFEADRFAKNLGRAHFLKCALIKINLDNLGFPVYDFLYSLWHNSHPSLLERIQALDKAE